MRTVSIDDGQLNVAVKWRVGYRFPVHCVVESVSLELELSSIADAGGPEGKTRPPDTLPVTARGQRSVQVPLDKVTAPYTTPR